MRSEPAGVTQGFRADLGCAGLLSLLTAWLYAPVLEFEFLHTDDELYVTKNALVLQGLTAEGVWRAFHLQDLDWFPVTFLSHMLDVSLFGLDPRGHHATNLVLHALNAGLVFLLLARGTGARVRAGLLALAFALHPLQVESVAWVAERKNLLSTLFGLCCIGAYGAYARRPGAGRYAAVVVLFAASLMSKAMLVTLPVLLLLLDVFPLGRWPGGELDAVAYRRRVGRLVLEKLPLCALSAATAVLALVSQEAGGALASMERLESWQRLSNAAISILRYLFALAWPTELSIFRPHPFIAETGGVAPSGDELAAAVALLLSLTGVIAWSRRRVLIAGWLWFLVSLLPVLGLVQLGAHGWADRYAYVPGLGVFTAVVWGVAELAGRAALPVRGLLLAGALSWLVALGVRTRAEQAPWHDSVALYEHALAINPGHAYMNAVHAGELIRQERLEEAVMYLERALHINPLAETHSQLATVLQRLGRDDEAVEQYRRAVASEDRTVEMQANLAALLVSRGELAEGLALMREVAAQQPGSAVAQYNLATALARAGRLGEAATHYRRVAELDPKHAGALFAWANVLGMQGDLEGAIAKLRQLLVLEPGLAQAERALARALALQGGAPAP